MTDIQRLEKDLGDKLQKDILKAMLQHAELLVAGGLSSGRALSVVATIVTEVAVQSWAMRDITPEEFGEIMAGAMTIARRPITRT